MDIYIPRDDQDSIARYGYNLATFRMKLRSRQAEEARGEGGDGPIRKILTDEDAIRAGYPSLGTYKMRVRQYNHANLRAAERRAMADTNRHRAQSGEQSASLYAIPRPRGF